MRFFAIYNIIFQICCLLFLTFVQKYVNSRTCCDKDYKKYLYEPKLFNILSICISLKTLVAGLFSNLKGSNVNTSMCSKMNIEKRLIKILLIYLLNKQFPYIILTVYCYSIPLRKTKSKCIF